VDLGGFDLGGTDLGGFDLGGAGLRLVVIDTRVREAWPPAAVESSPLDEAAAAIAVGDMRALGELLTAAHNAAERDEVQDMAVTMALRAGALGARAITDGPGRPVLALVPVRCLPDVRAAVTDWFTGQELRSPRFLTFTPAGGPQHA
jgi:galactokinase